MIQENLSALKKELPAAVTLVAVSKTKPNEAVLEAYESGHRDFGENYVQEMITKHATLPADIRWHFIGHLQTNKVKLIVPFVYLIHGVDSLKLLKEIDKQSEKIGRKTNCLLQIHIASEETKFGLDMNECAEINSSGTLRDLQHVNVIGFMGMATNTDDETIIKKEFLALKEFSNRMHQLNPSLNELSIGMSGDYKLALECGSTMLRIGSSIFGSRNYNK